MDGRAAALGFGDHGDDAGQHGFGADLVRAQDHRAVAVDGAADQPVARVFFDRQGLAGDHGFVHRARALQHGAVDRDRVAGPQPQGVAGLDLGERDFRVLSAGADPVGGFWGEVQQRADGAAGLFAGAQFQDLAKQDQDDNDRRGLEIHRGQAVHGPESGGEDAGSEGGGEAVEVGRAGAQGDEAEHVEAAVYDGSPGALEEGETGPEDDGGGEGELNPGGDVGRHDAVQAESGDVPAHFQHHDGDGEHRPDPKAAGHVHQFVVDLDLGRDGDGFQGHAAFGAASGPDLADVRVHGAGVNGVGHGLGFGGRAVGQIFSRIGGEFFPAGGAAEMEGFAAVAEAVLGGCWIDFHAANRIDRHVARGGGRRGVGFGMVHGGVPSAARTRLRRA